MLPLIGLRYDHHFSENWSTRITASYFTVEFGEDALDADGSLVSGRAWIEYRLQGRYGAGLAIVALKLDLEASKNRLTGSCEHEYSGPQLYLTVRS